jgi:SrtB family sortase
MGSVKKDEVNTMNDENNSKEMNELDDSTASKTSAAKDTEYDPLTGEKKIKRLRKPVRILIGIGVGLLVVLLIWNIVNSINMLEATEAGSQPAAAAAQPESTEKPVTVDMTPKPSAEPEETKEPEKETAKPAEGYKLDEGTIASLREELRNDKAINGDVKCILHFNSGLVHDPVLQSDNENYYLYLNWQTKEYQSYGSIVLDSRNSIDAMEQNTIIYGHYIYEFRNPDRTLVFTPLAQLTSYEVWQANRYVSVVTDHEIRYYEICAVYDCPLQTMEDGSQFCYDGLEYNLLSYSEDYFAGYKENIKQHEYYSTGVEYSASDRFLTLQTCIENHHESREIVLCRELDRIALD